MVSSIGWRAQIPPGTFEHAARSTTRNPFLSKVAAQLRRERPLAQENEFGSFIERTMFEGRPYDLPLSWFVTGGCSMDASGACTMCNFGGGGVPTASSMVEQSQKLLAGMKNLPMIYLTPLGSMFDEREVPIGARNRILQMVASTGCEVYGTESRPETITRKKMAEFRNTFGDDVELQVGLGLESSNAYIRRNCINKGLSQRSYLKAIEILREFDIKSMVHVLVKPAFMTESEALKDAVDSCRWAHENGADRIILLPTNIKPHTIVGQTHMAGRYRVPYLYTVAKILQEYGAGPSRPVTLSGIYAGTPIRERAANCSSCSDTALSQLQSYSATLDQALLENLLERSCACYADWERSLGIQAPALETRLRSEYEALATDVLGRTWWVENSALVLRDLALHAT